MSKNYLAYLFLILAAYCFMRCSPKYYNRIINNKFYGSYVKNFIECGPGRVLQGLVKKINRENPFKKRK